MQNLFNLGECLFIFCAFWIMVYAIWRAWSPVSAAAIGRMMRGIYHQHMSSVAPTVPELPELVLGTDTGTDTDETVPTVTRHMDDVDIIVLLAVQTKGGKYRYSANKIHALTGGNRETVLELVRQVQGKEKPTNGTTVT
jgi:hypothetical protein